MMRVFFLNPHKNLGEFIYLPNLKLNQIICMWNKFFGVVERCTNLIACLWSNFCIERGVEECANIKPSLKCNFVLSEERNVVQISNPVCGVFIVLNQLWNGVETS